MKNKWRQFLFLQLIFTVLLLIGCEADNSAVEPSEYVTYKDDKKRFTIDYPNNWTVDANRKDVTVMFLSPEENEQDSIRKSISVLVIPLQYEESSSIEKYKDEIVSGMKQSFPKSEVVSLSSKTINNYPAIEVVLEGKTSGKDYTVRANYIIKGKTGYVITFGYPTYTNKYSTVFAKVLNSFTIIDSDAEPTAYVTYKDDKNHFTIDYPNNWSTDITEKNMLSCFIRRKKMNRTGLSNI